MECKELKKEGAVEAAADSKIFLTCSAWAAEAAADPENPRKEKVF